MHEEVGDRAEMCVIGGGGGLLLCFSNNVGKEPSGKHAHGMQARTLRTILCVGMHTRLAILSLHDCAALPPAGACPKAYGQGYRCAVHACCGQSESLLPFVCIVLRMFQHTAAPAGAGSEHMHGHTAAALEKVCLDACMQLPAGAAVQSARGPHLRGVRRRGRQR